MKRGARTTQNRKKREPIPHASTSTKTLVSCYQIPYQSSLIEYFDEAEREKLTSFLNKQQTILKTKNKTHRKKLFDEMTNIINYFLSININLSPNYPIGFQLYVLEIRMCQLTLRATVPRIYNHVVELLMKDNNQYKDADILSEWGHLTSNDNDLITMFNELITYSLNRTHYAASIFVEACHAVSNYVYSKISDKLNHSLDPNDLSSQKDLLWKFDNLSLSSDDEQEELDEEIIFDAREYNNIVSRSGI